MIDIYKTLHRKIKIEQHELSENCLKIYIGILQWNIVESDVKHHNPTLSCFTFQKFLFSLKPTSKWKPVVKCYQLEYNNESDQLEGTYLEKMKLNDVEMS
jgi:hypothetical protein